MPLRFKSSENFTGILESSVALETLENQYDGALVELKVHENEHVMYLHHALDGPALTFYQKSIYPDPRASMSPLNVSVLPKHTVRWRRNTLIKQRVLRCVRS
jgi:hypothetical protein